MARLQDYLAAEGEDAEMSFTLARIFVHVGRLPAARIELERVLALDPAMQGADALMTALDREAISRSENRPRADHKAGAV
jgi:hypothetical protein